MMGYYRRDEETTAVLKNGWLHTGDIGKIDSQGFLYIIDRIKDMVKIANENIYCHKIEEIFLKQAGVKKCAIFGIKDPKKGEVLIAFVVLEKITVKEFALAIKSSLPASWFPKEIIQLSQEQFGEWENAALGKVKKIKAREYYEKNFTNQKNEKTGEIKHE